MTSEGSYGGFLLPAQALNLNGLVAVISLDFLTLEHYVLIHLAHHHHFLVRRLWTFHLRLIRTSQINFIQLKIVGWVIERDVLAAGKNLVTTMLFIPLRDG